MTNNTWFGHLKFFLMINLSVFVVNHQEHECCLGRQDYHDRVELELGFVMFHTCLQDKASGVEHVIQMVLNTNINALINKSINDFVIITHIYREFVTMYKGSN